jgi:ribose 5-phosphate isomerase B
MTVAFGCDHGGFALKEEILAFLKGRRDTVLDMGTNSGEAADYAPYAQKVCERVNAGEADFGVLVCGTGIGMSLAANKIHGIRCAPVTDTFTAYATRSHNDSNVIALGARVTGPGLALDILEMFLDTPFSGDERHIRRIKQIMEIEKENCKRQEIL